MFLFSPSAIFRLQHSLLLIYEKYDYTLPFGSFKIKSTPDFKPKWVKSGAHQIYSRFKRATQVRVCLRSYAGFYGCLCKNDIYPLYNVASFSMWFPSCDGKDLGTSVPNLTVVDLDQYNNQWRIYGRDPGGPGGPGPPFIFKPNWIFLETAPSISGSGWPHPPSPQLIWRCGSATDNNFYTKSGIGSW